MDDMEVDEVIHLGSASASASASGGGAGAAAAPTPRPRDIVDDLQQSSSPSFAEMDWVETPPQWTGWESASSSESESEALGNEGMSHQHTFYVVVDTNVLIESLQSFDLLCTCITRHLVVCVPWTVLCELDGLKTSSKKNSNSSSNSNKNGERARLAMRYLEHAFSSGAPSSSSSFYHHQPQPQPQRRRVRFLGQSMQEFRKATEDFGVKGLKQYSNDDLILQCTLQKQKMAEEKRDRDRDRIEKRIGSGNFQSSGGWPLMEHVLLLTNDRNLCLKSSACGVPAFSLERLMANFENILHSVVADTEERERERAREKKKVAAAAEAEREGERQRQTRVKEEIKEDHLHHDQLLVKPRVVADLDSDGLSERVLRLLLESLSLFIRETFVENFGRDWQSMVVVPPPWDMPDLFKLLKQHWFSLDLDQEVQGIIDLVQHVYERLHPKQKGQEKENKKATTESTATQRIIPKQTFLMFFEKSERLLSLIWDSDSAKKDDQEGDLSSSSSSSSSKKKKLLLLDQQRVEWSHLHQEVYQQT